MTTGNRAVVVNVLANVVDLDGDVLSLLPSFTQPSHGVVSLNADGSFTYTPSSGYRGVDIFMYTVTDGKGGMATGSVNVRGAPAGSPRAAGDIGTTNVNTAVVVDVLANDSDPKAACRTLKCTC